MKFAFSEGPATAEADDYSPVEVYRKDGKWHPYRFTDWLLDWQIGRQLSAAEAKAMQKEIR